MLFDQIRAHPDTTAHGREGYYHGENGEHTWLDIAQHIAEALAEVGIGSSEPTPFTAEEEKTFIPSEVSPAPSAVCALLDL